MAAEDWTEKYRPQTLRDIVGNPTGAESMKQWALSWEKGIPKYRALVLIGTPGIGKTSAAEALAREMGWGIVEMNASDQRTGGAIEDIAVRASNFNTFGEDGSFMSTRTGGRKLIVLDEADSLYGVSDKGAMPAIVNLIRNARQPVILICNDFYELSRKSSAIKTDTFQITFRKPQARSIETVLKKICARERIAIEPEAVAKIAENADGDLRAAVRDLQSLALGKKEITGDMADQISERESRSDMFQFVNAVFKKRDAGTAKRILRECDVDPPTVLLWLDENLPSQVTNRRELADCYDALSKADVYLGRVKKRMYYGLWSYANDLMVEGIINSLKSPNTGFARINFPSYLSKMSRSRSARALRTSVAAKLGAVTHASAQTILSESMEFFKTLVADDVEFRVFLLREAMLEDDELAYLLGCKADDRRIRAAMNIAFPPEEKPAKKKAVPKAKKGASDSPIPATGAKKTEPEAKKTEPEPPKEKPGVAAVPEETPAGKPAPAEEKPAGKPEAEEKVPEKKKQTSLFDFR